MFKLVTNFYNNAIVLDDLKTIFSRRTYWDRFNNKTILIIGAYGSIARYISYFLIYLKQTQGTNCRIILNGRNKQKCDFYFGDFLDSVVINTDDFSNEYKLNNVKIDFIIHAASNARPDLFNKFPVETIMPNVMGTNNLLANNKGVESFLYFSSGSVYGELESNDLAEIEEDKYGLVDFTKTMSCYAESKRMGELLCNSYSKEFGVHAKSARIHHTYGPTLDLNSDTRAFSQFVLNALNNEDIVLKTSGEAKRAFLYIVDSVLALFDILLLGNDGEAYNVASTQFITIKELARTICKINGQTNVRIEKNDIIEDNNSNRIVPPSIKKMENLGWKESYSIVKGFERTINSYKE